MKKELGSILICTDCGQKYHSTKEHSTYNKTCKGKKK